MTDISLLLFVFLVALYYVVFKFLKLAEEPRSPQLFYNLESDHNSPVTQVLKMCPIFHEKYDPPLLWGRNGHLHTFVFAKMCPQVDHKPTSRRTVKLADNSTVIFDIFEPMVDENAKQLHESDFTVVIVPGIANGSDSSYILSFCENVTKQGFRVVVLNHLGVLPVKLTSKRIFTYGSTCELKAMVNFVLNNYPSTRLMGLGFSLGGNIMVKYLGEHVEHQKDFLCALSVCQGYDITKACPALQEWDGFRRGYNWFLTQRVKQIIKNNWKELAENHHHHHGRKHKILTASSLQEIDEHFVKQMAGYQTVTDYYRHSSCSEYIDNIEIPMLLLNAQDDPIVPEELLKIPKNYVTRPNSKSIFLLTQFGGHLGFYEGEYLQRESVTWLNKALLQYLTAVVTINQDSEGKTPPGESR